MEAQLFETANNLHCQEVKKWKGMPCLVQMYPPPPSSQAPQSQSGITPTPSQHTLPPHSPSEAAARVTEELRAQDFWFFQSLVDGWIVEGPAIGHLLYVNVECLLNLTNYKFSKGIGSIIGRTMCNFTMSSEHFCSVLHYAIKVWKQDHDSPLMTPHTVSTTQAVGLTTFWLPDSLSSSHTMSFDLLLLTLSTSNQKRYQSIFNKMADFLAPGITAISLSMHHNLSQLIRLQG
eukprot:12339614-Ditylum_brightwellii.AAC.1